MGNIYVVDEDDPWAIKIAEKLMTAKPGEMVELTPHEMKKLVKEDGIKILEKENPAK